MRRLEPKVKINEGEYKGLEGIVKGYDRNKYYMVYIPSLDISEEFKGYYLDFYVPLKNKQRFQLPHQDIDEGYVTNKQLWERYKFDRKLYSNISTKFRDFVIHIDLDNVDEREHHYCRTLDELKSKIRYAMHHNKSFEVSVTTYTKFGFSSSPVITVTLVDDVVYCDTYSHNRKMMRYYEKIERGIHKEIDKYVK